MKLDLKLDPAKAIDIPAVLESLKEGKDPRVCRSLDMLNAVLEEYTRTGMRDYSVSTVARISSINGGPGYQCIRSTRNHHYRRLIAAWAAKAGTSMRKPASPLSRERELPEYARLLEKIDNLHVRAVFGQLLHELNKCKRDKLILGKSLKNEVVIQNKPFQVPPPPPKPGTVQVLPSLSGVLGESEIKALEYFLSDECRERNEWTFDEYGEVRFLDKIKVLPAGFASAVRKVLENTPGSELFRKGTNP
jgi:hypothetical protein